MYTINSLVFSYPQIEDKDSFMFELEIPFEKIEYRHSEIYKAYSL
jgi:hypothetical protein